MTTPFNKILEIAQEKCDEGTYLQIANLLKEAHNEKECEIENIDRISEIVNGYNNAVVEDIENYQPTHLIRFEIDIIEKNSYDDNFSINQKEFRVLVNENSSMYRNAKNIKIISLNTLKAEDMTESDAINICKIGKHKITRTILGRVVNVKKLTKKDLRTIFENN
jgi:hypothetical protein